jgi:integrase
VYLKTKDSQWTPKHAKQWLKNMEDYAFKKLGDKPIRNIKPVDVLAVMRDMEALEIYETRDRLLQGISSVFKYGIALEVCESNPTDIRILLKKRPKVKNFPCIAPAELPVFLAKLDELEQDKKVSLIPSSALRFLMLTATRTSEVRFARWADIDLNKSLWTIPAEQAGRKGTGDRRKSHVVPLSAQAVALLEVLKPITGEYELVFTNRSTPDKPISENTILKMIDNLGYKGKMTGHGFRSLCRTILSEMGFRFEVLEAILSHSVGDSTVQAYARSQYLEERKDIMQQWANYLDSKGKVVPLKARA